MRITKKEFALELEKVDKIMNDIWAEFGVEVPFLSKPVFEEDAIKLYNYIKDNSISDTKLFIEGVN